MVLLLNKDTKFESNSQPCLTYLEAYAGCFYWTKIQNLKAILNSASFWAKLNEGAFTEQRYKIWKQFSTTARISIATSTVLLLNKDTKFESNSQRGAYGYHQAARCFYWTKIQNLKAILNHEPQRWRLLLGAFTEQRYKIWKQFSTLRWTTKM